MEHIAIYKSAFLWEIDLVRDTFTELKIPHYVQSESLGGVRTAFGVTPTPGFGMRWFVLVPRAFEERAKNIIAYLNLSVDSDTKPFPVIEPQEWKSRPIVIGVLVFIAIIIFVIINSLR
jgi:hypothetical protein